MIVPGIQLRDRELFVHCFPKKRSDCRQEQPQLLYHPVSACELKWALHLTLEDHILSCFDKFDSDTVLLIHQKIITGNFSYDIGY
ncbi:hypothetical protein BpHYR1_032718 [Brachionus plicatilis]|uniref:Uncharacterized protein n=1 Tax=Brachionus plicatilis TaxID=10195 RepID=A0A3M7SJG1_BRAPC|nr:hypothetical protein BpHYR1_032718 [Brachionus plicatilis]